ncbi:MAG: tetratricopeptide repeat protein, partial [Planctomycetota bacterium]
MFFPLLWVIVNAFQEPGSLPVLRPGQVLKGDIQDHDSLVETEFLLQKRGDAPVLGQTFLIQIGESGPYHIDLRSWFFDAYLVLRDEEGRLLAEDDDGLIGLHSRIVTQLKQGRSYRVDACALHGDRGAFELRLEPGIPSGLSPQEEAAANFEDGKVCLKATEEAKGSESPEVATILDALAQAYQDQGLLEEARPLFERALAIREKVLGPEDPQTATA